MCGIGCGGNTEPKIVVGAAMRGRYNSDGKTEQKIEMRNDELSNAITTVQKDSLVVVNGNKKSVLFTCGDGIDNSKRVGKGITRQLMTISDDCNTNSRRY